MAPGVTAGAAGGEHTRIPVWGCVLIGGASTRMGRPKQLLRRDGVTWLELIVSQLASQVEQLVLAGRGEVPPALAHLPVLEDVPGLQGPLAGVLAAFRFQPAVSWLVAACDQPYLERAALAWLLHCRAPGVLAVLPDLRGDGRLEPLLAYYDWHCRELLEELAGSGQRRLSGLAGRAGVITPQPPAHLRASWRNINRPEDFSNQ